MLLAKIYVTFKEGVPDPQGETMGQSLLAMGYQGVLSVGPVSI